MCQRIVFDEFFVYQLRLEQQRLHHRRHAKGIALSINRNKIDAYIKQLPYTLTTAQQRVVEDVFEDISKPVSMNRLLQGDVGSGKTDVAFLTLLAAVEDGYQAALMAPTEILATQHYLKLDKMSQAVSIECCLIKGKMRKKERRDVTKNSRE